YCRSQVIEFDTPCRFCWVNHTRMRRGTDGRPSLSISFIFFHSFSYSVYFCSIVSCSFPLASSMKVRYNEQQ
ncbi:MAG: hypothetical protein ACOC44_03950, partial [Promethearchaeia archaeon]